MIIGLVLIMSIIVIFGVSNLFCNCHPKETFKENQIDEENSKVQFKEVNITVVRKILERWDLRFVVGDDYQIVDYIVDGSILEVYIANTPNGDIRLKYDLKKNGIVDLQTHAERNLWKKEIKEETVTEEEKRRFLAIALNNSSVKKILNGRDFEVSIVKYVMYAGGKKGLDPDHVFITFKVESEVYRLLYLA